MVVGIGSSVEGSKLFTTGTFLNNDKANLEESNLKITGASGISLSNSSTLFDFEFNANVTDCVLFGSLLKTSTTINDEVITGARGYNVGINKRGKLYYQGFDNNGDFIHTADSIELSKRNLVSFSVGANNVSFSRLDYLNNKIQNQDFNINSSFIANNDDLFLGGSDQYFRGGAAGPSGEFETSKVSLNSFSLFSGYIPATTMFSLGSGFIGEYVQGATPATFKQRVTGYNQEIVYQTGITGYDYVGTGSINIQTGTYMRTGNLKSPSTTTVSEGDRYFVYRTFDNALSASGIKTFVKEEVGFLHPSSGYQYLPTGEGAFDTLGLRDVDAAVQTFVEQVGISGSDTVTVQLYGSRMLYGTLSGISGVEQTPLTETIIDKPKLITSGIEMRLDSSNFKKDYIYYMGQKL